MALSDEKDTGVRIIIKDRATSANIATLQGVVLVSKNSSFITWIEVAGKYTGKNFAKYLILLFATFVSVNNIPIIKLHDSREDRLRNPRNIYKSLGFRYDMEEDPNNSEMTANVDDILKRGPKILINFRTKS